MLSQTKEEALKRFNYVQGHLDGVRRMVEEEKYCVDVIKQLFAVRRALEKLEVIFLDGHLNSCVVDGIREGRQKEVLQELVQLYAVANK